MQQLEFSNAVLDIPTVWTGCGHGFIETGELLWPGRPYSQSPQDQATRGQLGWSPMLHWPYASPSPPARLNLQVSTDRSTDPLLAGGGNASFPRTQWSTGECPYPTHHPRPHQQAWQPAQIAKEVCPFLPFLFYLVKRRGDIKTVL